MGLFHQNTIIFGDFAAENVEDGDNMYGFYGGLHIAPFGSMNKDMEFIVKEMGKYSFKKVACNNCKGAVAVQRMIDLGYPVVRGTARFGSQSDLYIGNGDVVEFG